MNEGCLGRRVVPWAQIIRRKGSTFSKLFVGTDSGEKFFFTVQFVFFVWVTGILYLVITMSGPGRCLLYAWLIKVKIGADRCLFKTQGDDWCQVVSHQSILPQNDPLTLTTSSEIKRHCRYAERCCAHFCDFDRIKKWLNPIFARHRAKL